MMRYWADELDRISEHGRVIKNEYLRKSVFKGGSSTCSCQGAPEVSAPLLVADVRSLS